MRPSRARASAALAIVTALLSAGCAQAGTPPVVPEAVDRAIERGLAYLAASQSPDGSYGGRFGRATGVVSLSGMAFLSKGCVPGQGPHGETLNRCVDYVLSKQDKSGVFNDDASAHGPMYSHNISTLFLCEVSGMVDPERQERVGKAIAAAVALILRAQGAKKADSPHHGGWRYCEASSDSDLSCSGWALMALRSARLIGAPVPDRAIDDAVGYLLRNHNPDTGEFGYQDTKRNSITLTGAAVLCLVLTGKPGHESVAKAGNFILREFQHLPEQEFPFYGTYYDAQATFQIGGRHWEIFSAWMHDYWLPKQREDGAWAFPSHCWMAQQGGDTFAYSTAMMVLSLAVPYRQLPIYQRDETVDESEEP